MEIFLTPFVVLDDFVETSFCSSAVFKNVVKIATTLHHPSLILACGKITSFHNNTAQELQCSNYQCLFSPSLCSLHLIKLI